MGLLFAFVVLSSLTAGASAALLGGLALGSGGIVGPGAATGPGTVASPSGASPFVLTPTLSVTPATGYPGQTVTFNAASFAKNRPITIAWTSVRSGATTVCAGVTSTTGTFSCSPTVPLTPAGLVKFTATVGAASASVSLGVVSHLVPTPATGSVGTAVTFSGIGFSGNGTGHPVSSTTPAAFAFVNWSRGFACKGLVSGVGTFNCTFVVPATFAGPHTFSASDAVPSDNTTAAFVITPRVTAGPSFGPVGTRFTLTGTGFASVATLKVAWKGNSTSLGTACRTNTSGTGDFSCQFVIPVGTVGGPYSFTATDGANNTASAAFSVSSFTVTPSTAPVATVVQFAAFAFTPNSTFTVTWSAGTVCSSSTNATGFFSCSLTLPATPVGSHTFAGTDGAGLAATANLTVVPSALATPSGGMPNTTVRFTGEGYAAGSLVQVSSPLGRACNATSGANGSFLCSYKIPAATPGGIYVFNATDAASDTATAEFVVTFLKESLSAGPVGTSIQFSAGGFAATRAFRISWQAGNISSCSGNTTAQGTFTCGFVIPPTAAGVHQFTASDAAGDTARTSFLVVPHLTINPQRNETAGSPIEFNATGFGASLGIAITWGGGTLCRGTTSVTGEFFCNTTVPAAPSGGYGITGTDTANNTGFAPLTIVSNLIVTPNGGPVGSHVGFRASGFTRNASLTISWSGGTVCNTTTNASGSVACNYTIPSVVPGAKVFTATDAAARSATTTFTVSPFVNATPASGPVGTPITFRGEGFAANSTVTVTWSNGFACSGRSDVTGRFACSFTITPAPAGVHSFTATDASTPTPNTATTPFTIKPELVLTPAQGRIGVKFTLNGSGFAASSVFAVTWVRGAVCNGTTSVTGSFACSFTIPAGTSGGPATFSATDAKNDTGTAIFLVTPVLTATPAAGPVGTTVTFQGAGFAPASPANITFAGGLVCNATTNATGAFSCLFLIPALVVGPHTFRANAGGANSTTTFTVVAGLIATPSYGPPGTAITFHGTGFAPNSSTSVLASPTLGPICSNTTQANGNFACRFTVPLGTAGGNYTFTATDSAAHSAGAPFVVSFLHATPASVAVGAIVTFAGAGFNPGVTFTLTWLHGGACAGTTTSSGAIANCTFRIPTTPAGAYTFKAQDRVGLNATAIVTVVPSVSASPTSGPVGTVFALSGTGFAANSTIGASGIGAATCASATNSVGSFAVCSLTVPSGTPAGTYTITVKDGSANSATVQVEVTPTLTDAPTGAPAGASVTFRGSGYAPSSPISVVWTAGTFCTATTNASGGFTCSAPIPAGTAGGAYTFTATDAAPHSASASFTVTFVASNPPTGVGGTRITFSGGGFHPASPVNVTWTGGTACTGTSNATGAFSCTFTIAASTALGLYTFTAKDGSGSSAQTSFDVLGTPSVTVPAASRVSADINQTVTFNTTASGGSGRFTTYAWTASSPNLGCAIANAARITCTPKAAGNYTVSVNVTDSNGITSAEQVSANVRVFTDPTLSAITTSRSAADVGQTVAFNVTPIGGTGVYSLYTWSASGSGLGCTIVNANAIACVPTANGSYAVTVTVRDSNGLVAPAVTSVRVTVSLAPTVGLPSADHASVDIGQAVTFSVVATQGAAPLRYAWNGLPTNCTSGAGSFTCSPSVANPSLTITVTVTDANNDSVTSGPLAFTVFKDPAISAPTPFRSKPYDVGQTVTFNVTATSSGSGGLTYTWLGLPKGCTAANATSITCPSLADGTTNITVQIVDTNHLTVTSKALLFTVNPDPSVSVPHPSRASADMGQALTLTVTVTGGAGAPSFLWSGLPAGCVPANATTVSCPSLTTPGPYSTMVMVTDASGFTNASASLGYTVVADPSVAPPSATHATLDVSQPVNFSTTASGGSGGLHYAWSGLPPGCTAASTPQIACAHVTTNGTYTVSVSVTDSNAFTVSSTTLTVTVYLLPIVTVSASPTSFLQGKGVAFTATVTGGAPGKLNYSWSHLPSGCVSVDAPTLSCTPTEAGTFNVTVTVNDINLGKGTAVAPIEVQSAFLGLPADQGYLLLTGVVLAGVAVAAVFLVRWGLRRKKGRSREQLY